MTATRVYRKGDQTPGAWKEFIQAMQSGRAFECDEEMFYYWLEVLPPARMNYKATLPDGTTQKAWFGFAEGAEEVTAFWQKDGRYFGCRTNEINPHG